MSRQQKIDKIGDLCDQHGCSEKIRKIHFDQFVNHDWHPHPPSDFTEWWSGHHDYANGIDAKRAYNCQPYRNQYLEAKGVGLA
jgi:hypothetical protein